MSRPADATPSAPLHLLIGVGLANALLYALGLRAAYPLAEGLRHPLASWATLTGFSWLAGLHLAGLYALLFGYYMLALRLGLRCRAAGGRLLVLVTIAGWLLASAILLGAYPGESLDIFDYLFRGRLLALLGVSPLATPPAPFSEQLFYAHVNWATYVDTYGPIWEYASGAVATTVAALSCDCPASLGAYVLGYRLLAVGLAGICGLLIYRIVWRHSPQHASVALLAWLWNPLLLTATAIGGHNDMLMRVFILGTVLLFQRRRWVWGLLALVLAAHVKLTALLLLPVLGLWLARRLGWWRAIGSSGAAAVLALPLSWLLYAPLGGWATLPRMLGERVSMLANSPAFAIGWLLQICWGWPEPAASQVAIRGATGLFFALAGLLLLRFWRAARAPGAADDQLLWQSSRDVTMAFLVVGSFWFQAWYLLWVLVLAVLLPADRFTLRALPVCCLLAVWLYIATDVLLRLWRPALASASISDLGLLNWVVLLLGAACLPMLWRAARMPPVAVGLAERLDSHQDPPQSIGA